MNILILNGSPKGPNSITLQTLLYLEQLHPEHSFRVLHVGQRIRALEQNFAPALEELRWAELMIFAYPVYTFLAPYQLHRFIRLLKESGEDLSGKFAAQVSTSKHFYDVTAHTYIKENSLDLGLRYLTGLSADMDDLLSEKGQREARDFFDFLLWKMERKDYAPFPAPQPEFTPAPVSLPEQKGEKAQGDVVIIADLGENSRSLQAMVDRFRAVLPRRTRVVNIREYPFQGGCLSCFRCAGSGECIYKDGFDRFLREEIQKAEAIVYAFSVEDHAMGTRFKLYDDRQFCNGHRTVTMGTPVGYLVSGAYSREENLRTVVEARAQVGGNFLAGVATDEQTPDAAIDRMAETLCYALEHRYVPPQNFYGIGGMKIFRDLIWMMQGLMRADHKFYKSHGQYDFPQKKRGTMLMMYLAGAVMRSPRIRAKAEKQINEGMIGPYKKVLEKAKSEKH